MSELITETENIEMKYIPGYEGFYSATKDGRIYRHKTDKREGGFVCIDRKTKYIRIRLVKNSYEKWEAVHRLIALTFLENPENKPQVNHKNLNTHDNSLENLEWCTWRENWNHAMTNNRYRGKMLKENEKLAVGFLYENCDYKTSDLAEMFKTSRSSIKRHIKAYKLAA